MYMALLTARAWILQREEAYGQQRYVSFDHILCRRGSLALNLPTLPLYIRHRFLSRSSFFFERGTNDTYLLSSTRSVRPDSQSPLTTQYQRQVFFAAHYILGAPSMGAF